MNKILVVAAHPDDEALGLGGSISKWVAQGKDVIVMFMADGETSRQNPERIESFSDQIKLRNDNAIQASEVLGHKIVDFCNFPDNRMDQQCLLDIVKRVERIVNKYRPDTIFTHHARDLNVDHRITFQAVMTACRPLPDHSVKRVLSFEVPSATGWFGDHGDFSPNYFISINESHWRNKTKALNIYSDEMRLSPHARSASAVDALSVYRGSSVGVERAESFSIIRWIEE